MDYSSYEAYLTVNGDTRKERLINQAKKAETKRIKALIGSMTPKERENPDLMNPSRKKRIVTGSGVSELQINKILKSRIEFVLNEIVKQ